MGQIEKAVQRYAELKEMKAAFEREMEGLKPTIVAYLKRQPGCKESFRGILAKVVHKSRENFSLARAKEKIDGRTLAPYITVSEWDELHVD